MKTITMMLLVFLLCFLKNSFAQYAPIKSILEVEGPVNSNIALGTGIIGLGDINGDGNPDFAVSAWNAKKTYIYYGGKGVLDGVADDSIPGGGTIEKGDLNGDGIMDLVIKINGDTSWVNYLAIYLGRKNTAHKYDTIPSLIIREEQINSGYGTTFAVGDLNNDGYDDLVVGAWNYDSKGKVYIYFGGKVLTKIPNYTGIGNTACNNFALNVKIGDINGDGISDLLLGSNQQLYCNINDSGYVGILDIYYGKPNWIYSKDNFDFQFKYNSKNSNLNNIYYFSTIDINADSIKDIAFPGDSGKMYFIFGDKYSLSSSPNFTIKRDSNDYDYFGYDGPAANVGDINNDGKEDFIIRAFSSGSECIHLFLGNQISQTRRVAVRCKGTTNAFSVVVPVGDVNGDGINDFGSIAPNNIFPPNDGYFVIFSGDSGYVVTSIKENSQPVPLELSLQQNYPNPFNPTTTIEYTLKKEGNVVLKIFDSIGKEIKTLVNMNQRSGNYKVIWDGTDNKGEKVSSGIYFYRLQIDNATVTKKAVFIK